ncbi:MAG: hypothetical protein K8S55_08225 [Phycisphaerae bacterium]|nr:hypothetical protein [Phycisphaerae bacterium]
MKFSKSCVVLTLAFAAACAQADPNVILEDDFSGTKINSAKWKLYVPKGTGGFIRIEDGVLHVLSCDRSAFFTTKKEIPSGHILEFDYFQPSKERKGSYQNHVLYSATRDAKGRKCRNTVWYVEQSGCLFSHHNGLRDKRGAIGNFPPSRDKWYRVRVLNQARSTTIIVRDRKTGKLCSRATFSHDPVSSGRIQFVGGAYNKGSRLGFKLDNVRILSKTPVLGKAPTPLVPPGNFETPANWKPLDIAGRNFWHLAYYKPHAWKLWGMSKHPLFAEAAWLHAPTDEKAISATPRPFTMRPARTKAGRERQVKIVKAAGDKFLGFYPPMNEWGDVYLRRGRLGKATSRDDGLARIKRMYIKRADTAPVKRATFSLMNYRLFHHHALEWGSRSVTAEIGETVPCTNLQIACTRGAAREYGRPWGIDLSSWLYGKMTHYVYTPDFISSPCSLYSGHSVSLHKRFCYASWLAGANYIWYENEAVLAMNENDIRQVIGCQPDKKYDRWVLSPVGEIAQKLFALAKIKDRGTPYTPVALMIDFAHGWSPLGCTPHKIWANLPLAKGDHMLDEFFNTIYPWNPARDYSEPGARKPGRNGEQGFLTPTPYGDIFDVFTNKSCRTLAGYRVLMMVGDVRIDKALAAKLIAYVKNGGTLVINAKQLGAHLPAKFLGAKLTGQSGTAKSALCKLDGKKLAGAAFSYAKVELTTAKPLVTADGGKDALACINEVGKGRVVLTTPPYLLNKKNRAVPMLKHLLKHLTSGLLPVRVSEGDGLEYTVNRTAKGWVVGLINNKGIYKQPTGPPTIRPEEEIAVMVRLDGVATKATEWITGKKLKMKTTKKSTTVRLVVPAGDVRIIELEK